MYHKILDVLKMGFFFYLTILAVNLNQKPQISKHTSALNKGLANMEQKPAPH